MSLARLSNKTMVVVFYFYCNFIRIFAKMSTVQPLPSPEWTVSMSKLPLRRLRCSHNIFSNMYTELIIASFCLYNAINRYMWPM